MLFNRASEPCDGFSAAAIAAFRAARLSGVLVNPFNRLCFGVKGGTGLGDLPRFCGEIGVSGERAIWARCACEGR